MLLASIDFARAYLHWKAGLGYDKKVHSVLQEIKSIDGLSFLTNDDFTRLVLTHTDGKKAAEFFKQKGIYAEFYDLSRVVFIVSLAESMQNLLKLKQALQEMPHFEPPTKNIDFNNFAPFSILTGVSGKITEVEIECADGYVCVEQCGVYPPCVPLFLKGEKIQNAKYLKNFKSLFGIYDGKIRVYAK